MTQGIVVTRLETGAAVQFPKDRALIESLKATFPKARWGEGTRSWHIPGKLAFARAERWATAHDAALRARLVAAEAEKRDAEWDGRETDPGKALVARKSEVKSRNAVVSDTGVVRYPFAYNAEAVAIARTLPGARFDRDAKSWSFRPSTLSDVDSVIAGCAAILQCNLKAQKAEEDRKAAQRTRVDRGRAGAIGADEAGSEVWLQGTAPREGVPFLHRGSAMVATRTSKSFRVDLDCFAVNTGGVGLPSLEEEWCVRVWLRAATAAEEAPLRAAAQQAAGRKAEADALREIVAAKAAEARLASGRPVHVGDLVSMEMCGRLGIGEPITNVRGEQMRREHPEWNLPPLTHPEAYALTLDDARALQQAYRARLTEERNEYRIKHTIESLEKDIARYEGHAARLATMSPEEHACAEAEIAEGEARRLEHARATEWI